jgi:hypothetical protein
LKEEEEEEEIDMFFLIKSGSTFHPKKKKNPGQFTQVGRSQGTFMLFSLVVFLGFFLLHFGIHHNQLETKEYLNINI